MNNLHPVHIEFLRPEDFAQVETIETAKGLEAWTQADMASQLKNVKTIGIKAVIDGQLAGYAVYQRNNEQQHNSILKFVVNPDFASSATDIQEAMLEAVREDMVTQGRTSIVFYTSSQDRETLDFIAKKHGEYRRYDAAGTDDIMLVYDTNQPAKQSPPASGNPAMPPSLGYQGFVSVPPMDGSSFTLQSFVTGAPLDGDQGFNMTNAPDQGFNTGFYPTSSDGINGSFSFDTYNTPDISITAGQQTDFGTYEEEELPALPKIKPLSPAAVLIRGREKLTELTGMEWETVTLNRRGKFNNLALTPETPITEDVYFRTASKVAAPQKALAALYEFLGERMPRTHIAQLDKSVQLAIPASLVRPIHLALGRPGKLAEAFTPASTQLRYQWSEEVDEPKRQLRR